MKNKSNFLFISNSKDKEPDAHQNHFPVFRADADGMIVGLGAIEGKHSLLTMIFKPLKENVVAKHFFDWDRVRQASKLRLRQ